MNKLEVRRFEMFDTVVHKPTGFVFKFFQYEEDNTCSVMDELESLYFFPIDTIKFGTERDLEIYIKQEAKKFQYLRNYL